MFFCTECEYKFESFNRPDFCPRCEGKIITLEEHEENERINAQEEYWEN